MMQVRALPPAPTNDKNNKHSESTVSLFDEVRAEFDEEYRLQKEREGYIRVPISLARFFKTDWVHKQEVRQIQSDIEYLVNISRNEEGQQSYVG